MIPAEAIGFGVDDPPPLRLRHVRKPPKKEPAGAWWAVCGLWGFDRAAASARDGQAGVVASGLLPIIENWSPQLHSTASFSTNRRHRIAGTGAIVVRRRERHVPAGGWCNEAVTGVMASGF